ncbi:MAG: hypothetical protein SGPRY_002693, partial [Prymnesium sp.]
SARFSRDGGRLVSCGDDKSVRVWSVATASPLLCWRHSKKLACVAFSPDDDAVIFSDKFGEVYSLPLIEKGGEPGSGKPSSSSLEPTEPTLLLAHLSPISHVSLPRSLGLIFTADREGHVRASRYPHSFVIESFYLHHTSPLKLMLPLSSAPLLLTVGAEGKEVCWWSRHEQGLMAFTFSAEKAVHFATLHCSWDGAEFQMTPNQSLTITLPQPAVAIECSPSGAFCILMPSVILLSNPEHSCAGFDLSRALQLELPPPPLDTTEHASNDEEEDEMNDE